MNGIDEYLGALRGDGEQLELPLDGPVNHVQELVELSQKIRLTPAEEARAEQLMELVVGKLAGIAMRKTLQHALQQVFGGR